MAGATSAPARYEVPVTKYRNLVRAAKISAVAFVAVGIEFFITRQFVLAAAMIVAGVAISLWPVKVDIAPDAEPAASPKEKKGRGGAIHPLEEL
jgi:hypothetical protein